MDSLIARALDTAAARGASYADARMVETAQERYSVRTGVVDVISSDESLGIGVRVVVDGAWGFASTNTMTAASVDQAAALAVEIAKASATSGGPKVELGTPVTSRGVYTTPVEIDPFSVSPEEKVALLLDVDGRMGRVEGISARTGNLIFIRERKAFANSEGADVEQTIYEAGGGIQATAVGNGEVQRRSYPNSMGRQQGVQRVGVCKGLRPGGQRGAGGQRGRGVADGGQVSFGHHHHADYRRLAGGVADS